MASETLPLPARIVTKIMPNANFHNEPELDQALTAWEPPEVPLSLDQRVLASYRQHVHRRSWLGSWLGSWWERFFTTSIRVPLPVVAIQVLLLLIAGAGFVAFFTAKSEEVMPFIASVPSREMMEPPVVSKKTIARPLTRVRKSAVRVAKQSVAPPVVTPILPRDPAPRPSPSAALLITESAGWQLRPDPALPKLHPEWIDAALVTESRPSLPVTVSYPRPVMTEQLQTERLLPTRTNFDITSNASKAKVYSGRMSRTVALAGEWFNKPLEKSDVLYRWIPNAIPTVTSFVEPAKNACFSPFRSKPQLVDMQ